MSHDYHIEPMREFVGRTHKHGSKLGIQLHHPGRQGYCSVVNTLPMILPIVELHAANGYPIQQFLPPTPVCARMNMAAASITAFAS